MQRKWRRCWERGKAGSGHLKGGLINPLSILAKSILPPVAAAGILLGSMTGTYANPAGGQITGGTGSITENGSSMTITQNTDKLAINWQSFSIGSGETVQFIQPGKSSIALNRVLGNDASGIYGSLLANGQVFLINPNGVLFAPGSQVSVGGIVASTLDISDSDFLAGNYKFTGSGGAVTNQGTITAANGGYVALLGSQVTNEGIIVAQQGTVALGAGNAVTLDLEGDGLLSLAVDQAAVNASAANHHLIQADGGQVIMTARTAGDLAGTVLNNTGVIEARGLSKVNGQIILGGGTNGTVTNSGTLDASGKNVGETGGTVKMLGEKVTLADGAKVDVSGDSGGGTVLIGGNYQGKGTEQNATATMVAATATINADAITSGNGGKVVVWANDTTNYAGRISARGGINGGNGGSAEVSGKRKLVYQGTTDLRAPQGTTGTLLLDPADYTIADTGGDMTPEALATALDSANVTILSSDGTVNTDGSGDVNVNSAVAWDSGNTLTLSAYRDVNVNTNITGTGGGNLVIRADNTGAGTATLGTGHGTVIFGADAAVSLTGGDGSGNKVSIYYNPVSYSDAATRSDWAPWWPAGSQNPYKSKVTGNLTAYMLVNTLDDLQNINNNTKGIYALGKDIDASATSGWNSGKGFTPIGYSTGDGSFSGILDGDGYVINHLYIDRSGDSNSSGDCVRTGLFAQLGWGGIIRNVGLEHVDITGAMYAPVGGLVGYNNQGTITNCYVTGTVTGLNGYYVGGLVGQNGNGSIANSSSSAAVNSKNSFSYLTTSVGGLVGGGYGSITDSYSTGAVTAYGGESIGGLVGSFGSGSITNCYSTGAVTITSDYAGLYAGGLAGDGYGSITNSYSTGAVTVNSTTNSNSAYIYVGGLAGTANSIDNSYSTGAVAVNSSTDSSYSHAIVGGLAGRSGAANSYSTGAVTVTGNYARVGGLLGEVTWNGLTNAYSTGAVNVSGSNNYTGGLVGNNEGGTIIGGYWDMDTSGQSIGVGNGDSSGTAGLSTTGSSPFANSSYSDFNFTNTWFMVDGYTRPFLRSEYSTKITNAHQLQLMAIDLSANYTLGSSIDLSGAFTSAAGLWNPVTGFVSVGSDPASGGTAFTGTINGDGYVISGLTINNSTATSVGLFGYTKDATISNVGLSNVNITGGANAYVGGLAGYSDGGSITRSFTTGTVNGGTTGGLVGVNNSTITNSYSMSDVGGSIAGGLVGANAGSITTSYSTGAVNSNGGTAGGLVGANTGSITNTYSAGPVNSNGGTAGGLVGDGSGGTVTDSVWATDIAGQTATTGVGNDSLAGGVTGMTTVAMIDHTQYDSNWDFANTWFTIDGATLPFLRSEYSTTIMNGHQLQLMAMNLSANYTLGADIDMSELTKASRMCKTSTGFTPVGSDPASGGMAFTGTLDGKGYVINGLVINNPVSTGAGLFGYTQDATISDVGLSALKITGGANNLYVGGLVGYNGSGSSITDVSVAGSVTGNGGVGGLAGSNAGSITNVGNAGLQVSGTGNVGGLAGSNNSIITNSANTGTVTGGLNSSVGGLTGLNNSGGTITSSCNAGTVIANGVGSKAGGLAGTNSGSITSSYGTSAGTVTGNSDQTTVGGLVGENDGSITSSYNASVVAATSNATNSVVGGVIGKNNASITGLYNTGAVTSNAYINVVGGLVGENDSGSIAQSYNIGAVTGNNGTATLGGLVGANGTNGTVTTSYNVGTVTANGADSTVGGLVGENIGSITNSYTINVTTGNAGNTMVGGLVGENAGSITYAYSIGATTGNGAGITVGGLVGTNGTNGTVTDAYWDTETTGQTSGVGSGGTADASVRGLTTAALMQSANYTNWDITNTWGIVNGATFPYHKWQFSGTPNIISGIVQDGGLGKTVELVASEYLAGVGVWSSKEAGQTSTVADNGFYYLVLPTETLSSGNILLLYVAGDSSYKANSVYYYNGCLNGADMVKDTLIIKGGEGAVATAVCSGGYYNWYPGIDCIGSETISRTELLSVVAGGVTLNASDMIFSYDGYKNGLSVTGNLLVRDGLLNTRLMNNITATGSITIYNTGDFVVNPAGAAATEIINIGSQTISAGGDITIVTSGNLIIAGNYKFDNSTKTVVSSDLPSLSAGGDITLVAGTGFVNYNGNDAFKLTGSGRWLVYAPDQLIYSSNKLLYSYVRVPRTYSQVGTRGDLLAYDARGGLPGDFILWDTEYGQSIPAIGSGFVYATADPLFRSLTPTQLVRQGAITAAQAGNVQGLDLTAANVAASGSSDETLPFLTIIGEGIAQE